MGVMMTSFFACGPRRGANAPAQGTASQPQAGAASAPAEKPVDLTAMFERESTGLQPKPVSDAQGGFDTKVSASAAPTVQQVEGMSVVEIPIGSQAPVRCQIFPDEVDSGGTLQGVVKDLTAKVQPKRVAPWSVRVIGESPATFVSVIYHAQSPRGTLVGELKLALHAVPTRPVLCMHDEPGYKKTFESVVSEFGESLKLKKAPPGRSFLEVQTAHISGQPVGFSKSTLRGSGKEREFSTNSMLMLSKSETELAFRDSINIETIDPQDRLLRAVWVDAAGGEVGMSIKLEQLAGKQGTYRYEGKVQGKPVSGELTTKDRKPLPSTVATFKRLAREGKKGGAFNLVLEHYVPDLDPTKLVETKYTRASGDPAQTFRYEAATFKFTGKLDAQGLIESAELPVGAATLTFHRDLLQGKL
jgi:hypothetical protein